jgi:type IV pilus assembly protein PilO
MALALPTDPKQKNALVFAALLALGVGAYWYVVWKPAQAEINITAARADSLEANNARIKADVESGVETKLRADAERFSVELAALRRLVPTQNEVPQLVNQISTAARQAGMDISDIAPDGVLPGDQFDAIRYKLSVTGPYHKVAEFLTSIGSLPRIITPINLELFPSGKVLERRPGKNETFVDAKFGVVTYVAKTMAPPRP